MRPTQAVIGFPRREDERQDLVPAGEHAEAPVSVERRIEVGQLRMHPEQLHHEPEHVHRDGEQVLVGAAREEGLPVDGGA